ncbi:MAG: hypothetical protein IT251_02610 [Chitinophagaceae bacterium]|nr:hypothetical protein [Chitinophagaceae bacterium]
MKSIIKLLVCITVLITNIKKAESQVPDTAQYLLDSIQPKFSYYIGKPLKVLLSDLKIQVVYYHSIPRWDKRLKDTVQFSQTLLNFHTLDDIVNRMGLHIKSPAIYIKFAQPIPIPKAWFMHGGRFEKDVWDLQKERFFRNFIVGEIAIRGI